MWCCVFLGVSRFHVGAVCHVLGVSIPSGDEGFVVVNCGPFRELLVALVTLDVGQQEIVNISNQDPFLNVIARICNCFVCRPILDLKYSSSPVGHSPDPKMIYLFFA